MNSEHGKTWRKAAPARASTLPATLRGQRVVPLPLAVAAVLIPFLTVWASAHTAQRADGQRVPGERIQGSGAEARPLDEPYVFLGRDVRIPESDGGYVDVWAVPSGWEAKLLQRRGAVSSPGRN